MNSLKDIKIEGLKGLRENGLKGMKVSGLRGLILKPKTAYANMEDMEDLKKSREQVKGKIKKLVREKKEIEFRIDLIQKSEKEKSEEMSELSEEESEFPWREEIFPPLPRKVSVKKPGHLEVKNASLQTKDTGFSEVKAGGTEIKVKGADEKPEEKIPEGKRSEDKVPEDKIIEDKVPEDKIIEDKVPEDKIIEGKVPKGKIPEEINPNISQTIIANDIANDAEEADPKSGTGRKDGEKDFPEKKEKISSSESSIEKSKTEGKNNPAASLFGDSLIEELLNSDDLNPEEEQGFIRYLEEQEVGELIADLKNVRALLTRAENAG